MAHDVFISYSSKDKPVATAACAALESHGINCWIAPRDIGVGADYGASIMQAIASAQVFVLVFSSHAGSSPHIVREVERAISRGVPVMPLRIEDIRPTDSLEYFISASQWFDAFPPPLEDRLEELAHVIARVLQKGTSGEIKPARKRLPAVKKWWLWAGAAAAFLLAAIPLAQFEIVPAMSGPPDSPKCLVMVSNAVNPAACARLLDANAAWQDCSTDFADSDMAARIATAKSMMAKGYSGHDLYFDQKLYSGAYGPVSHYWEMLGYCVNRNYIAFADISDGMAFPDGFWGKTRALREMFLKNWKAPGKPDGSFMENFRDLCKRYKAEREKARAGSGNSLDCNL